MSISTDHTNFKYCGINQASIVVLGLIGFLTTNLVGAANEDDEKREEKPSLIAQADELHKSLVDNGSIYSDDVIEKYILQVVDSILPDSVQDSTKLNFFILRDPIINAFAAPNGNIYVTIGLLARLENEAQLAFVLAHEIAHIINEHGHKAFEKRKSTIVKAHIADLLLLGSSIAYIPAAMSLASYSRDQELDADQMALTLIRQAGYDVYETQRFFDILGEIKAIESVKGSVYSSHPTNVKRMEILQEMIELQAVTTPVNPNLGHEVYSPIRQAVLFEDIRLKLNQRLYELARDTVKIGLVMSPNQPMFYYHRGESYRLTADDPTGAAKEYAWIYQKQNPKRYIAIFEERESENLTKAEHAFNQALEIDPNLHLAFRGLGLVALKRGKYWDVRKYLDRYLDQDKPVKDRRYMERILKYLPEE